MVQNKQANKKQLTGSESEAKRNHFSFLNDFIRGVSVYL